MIKYMLLMKTIANSRLRHRRYCDKIDKLSVNLTQKREACQRTLDNPSDNP